MTVKSDSTTLAILILIALALTMTACAALQPTDTSGPRANLPPYPIIANESARFDAATLAWQQLSQRYGLPQNNTPDLQPLTATLHSVPSNSGISIFMPKVGLNPTQTEEETRESLRRFITEWRSLIGADPVQLSLVERTDDASGLKTARYEQRPFRYPLRGNFGKLSIRFQADRRVVDVSSSCLPNVERLQAALNGLVPKVTPENAATLVVGHQITAPDAGGQTRSFTLPATTGLDVVQLVAYVLPSLDQQTLELRLAWEIDVTNGPIKTIYLDAISEEVIAVT